MLHLGPVGRRSMCLAGLVVLAVGLVACSPSVATGGDRDEEMRQDPEYEEKMARASATPDRSKAPDPSLVPPPPDLPPLLPRDGFFRVPPWDTRHLPEEELNANPLERPGSHEFARCLETYGFEKVDGEAPFGVISDGEIQAIVGAVNLAGPFVVDDGPRVEYAPNETSEQFLDCALKHLLGVADTPTPERAPVASQTPDTRSAEERARDRLNEPESPPGTRSIDELPPEARVLPTPVDDRYVPPPFTPDPTRVDPTPIAGPVTRISSQDPWIQSEADLAAYVEQQHSLLTEIAALSPDLFIRVGVTFAQPLRDDALTEAVPLGPESSLGNLQIKGPNNVSAGGGAQFMLPLSQTEAGMRDMGLIGPNESLLGVTYTEMRGPIDEIVAIIGQPNVALVDPGNLREFASLRLASPDARLSFDLPSSMYSHLHDFRGAP